MVVVGFAWRNKMRKTFRREEMMAGKGGVYGSKYS